MLASMRSTAPLASNRRRAAATRAESGGDPSRTRWARPAVLTRAQPSRHQAAGRLTRSMLNLQSGSRRRLDIGKLPRPVVSCDAPRLGVNRGDGFLTKDHTGLHDVAVGESNGGGCRTTEHDIELREAEDKG